MALMSTARPIPFMSDQLKAWDVVVDRISAKDAYLCQGG